MSELFTSLTWWQWLVFAVALGALLGVRLGLELAEALQLRRHRGLRLLSRSIGLSS